jgi:ribonuclease BN (tRNA processing enzyme)
MLSVQNGRILRMRDVEDVYYVQSESKPHEYYRVTLKQDCECKDFEIRGGPCKHVIEVLQYLVAAKNKNKVKKKNPS